MFAVECSSCVVLVLILIFSKGYTVEDVFQCHVTIDAKSIGNRPYAVWTKGP